MKSSSKDGAPEAKRTRRRHCGEMASRFDTKARDTASLWVGMMTIMMILLPMPMPMPNSGYDGACGVQAILVDRRAVLGR